MLLLTNSYIVPKDRRPEHSRLMRRFRQALAKLGCDSFEVYEQVGTNWGGGDTSGRFVQIMRFRDRKHQLAVQAAERADPVAQAMIAEFCKIVNFEYQQQQGFFAVGFYNSVLPVAPARAIGKSDAGDAATETEGAADETATEGDPAGGAEAEHPAPAAASPIEAVEEAPESATVVEEVEGVAEDVVHEEVPGDAPLEIGSNGDHYVTEGAAEGHHEMSHEPLSEEELLGELSAAPAEPHLEEHHDEVHELPAAPAAAEEPEPSAGRRSLFRRSKRQ